MNTILEAIANRRSVRAYEPEQITTEQRNALIMAALQSPSAMDVQPWHFSIVQNKALIEEINKAACDHVRRNFAGSASSRFSDPEFNVFYEAPTVIFISLDRATYASQMIDVGIAAENIALAATGLGLGSVILGLPREAFASEKAASFRKALEFPENYDFAIAIAVGKAAMTKPAHEHKPNRFTIIP